MSFHPGKFTWFEHLSSDPSKARQFYEMLFGWKVVSVPMGVESYDMIQNGEQGIGGLFKAQPGDPNHWISYLSVSDLDASYQAALAAGAKRAMAPKDFPPAGRGASLIDPTGARFSLWKSAQGDREDKHNVAMGDWVWNELTTQDVAQALNFYEGVFGYTHEEMDMGSQGKYYVLKGPDGKSRGGMMKAPHPNAPALWMPYVRVEQIDAIAERAAAQGAQLMMSPEDVPHADRICAMFDPLGAAIGIIRPTPM